MKNSRVIPLLGSAIVALMGCRRTPNREELAPRFLVWVLAAGDRTAFGASLYATADLAYRDARCLGVRTRDGHEPASLEAGRVEVFVNDGAVIGHADRRGDGTYQAAVQTVVPAGTPISASIAGSAAVPEHRFHTPAPVPRPVRMTSPARGFALPRGAGLAVRWEGGDASDVMVTVQVSRGADPHGAGWTVTCVAPRREGAFTVPAAAFAESFLPQGADTVTVVATADARVREGEYAVDVTPVGSTEDFVSGSIR